MGGAYNVGVDLRMAKGKGLRLSGVGAGTEKTGGCKETRPPGRNSRFGDGSPQPTNARALQSSVRETRGERRISGSLQRGAIRSAFERAF